MQGKRGANTIAVHAGRGVDPHSGAVSPAIQLSTTFARGADGELVGDYLYGRHHNPNREALEVCLSELEGAAGAMAFGSGCAVAHAIVTCLAGTDRLVVSDDMYFGIRTLLRQLTQQGHFELREVNMRDLDALSAACAAPVGRLLVMCESPTNPLMRVVDIGRIAEHTHAAGGELVVDNTMATPVLQQPLALGADYVMHSTTKFMGGHSDVIGGAIAAKNIDRELWQRLSTVRQLGGGVPSPFDCWLLLRSMATLVLRVERQCDNAARLAEWLHAHPAVEDVLYPGLPTHPGHATAVQQMRLPGSMMGLLLRGGYAAAAKFVAGLRLITVATSLGGVHSLAEHRARVEGAETLAPPQLVRLSVGIEDYDDIAQDVADALGSL